MVELLTRMTRYPPFRPRAHITLAQHEVLHRTCGRPNTGPSDRQHSRRQPGRRVSLFFALSNACALLRFHSAQLACRAVVERRWKLT